MYNKEEVRQILELDFSDTPEKLKGDYLDMYEGIQSDVISPARFDKNSGLSKTYFDRIDVTRTSKIVAEVRFPILGQGYKMGKSVRWNRMSDTIEYMSKQILHVQITLLLI